MGLAATVFYNKLIPLAQIFSLPYSGWHGLLFHFCTYRAESVCWVCALRRGTSCPIFPTSASWEGFVQPPTLRHAPLFKTKSLYIRLFSSSLIPKHLKWSWNAMCLYTLGGLLNASWVKTKNKPTKKKKTQKPIPTLITCNLQSYFHKNCHSTVAFRITKVLRKEEAGFVLIWQFYSHGRKLNCSCFSDNLVPVNWLTY